MRRTFAVIGFSSFFVCLACIYFGASFSKAVAVASVLALAVTLVIKQTRKLAILYVLFGSLLLSSVLCLYQFDKIEMYNQKYCTKPTKVEATLINTPEISDRTNTYTFKTNDKNKVKFNLASSELISIDIGDVIKGEFEFSQKYANFSQGVYFSAYVKNSADVEVIDKPETFNLPSLRRSVTEILDKHLNQGQGLTKAILFGDKTDISDEEYMSMLKCGLLHATATSGLHLTIVSGFVFFILSLFFFSRKQSSIISIIFIVMFMVLVGFRYSLLRAGIMTIVYLFANVIDRESDAVNSIGFATFIIICVNPYCVVDCSFLLSVSATLGMALVLTPLTDKIDEIEFENHPTLKKILLMFVGTALQSAVATLFTLPIAYIYFGYVSVIGVVVNAIVSPIITFILISGLLLVVLSFVPFLPNIIGQANDFICGAFWKLITLFSRFKYCLLNIDYWFVPIVIAIASICISVAILLYYAKKLNKQRLVKITSLIIANIALVFVLINLLVPTKAVEFTVQNASSGVLVYAFVDGKSVCIDTGSNKSADTLFRQLAYHSCDEIDTLIIPNCTNGEQKSAKEITNKCKVNTLVCGEDLIAKSNVFERKDILKTSRVSYENLEIDIINQGESSAVCIKTNSSSVLIINNLIDCSKLPEKYLSTNLLILDDVIPYNIDSIKTEQAIVYTYDETKLNYYTKHFDCYYLVDEYAIGVVMSDKLELKVR